MIQLVFATNNINKLREIKHILGNSFSLLSLRDIGMEADIPENEATLEGNAMHKARHIYEVAIDLLSRQKEVQQNKDRYLF